MLLKTDYERNQNTLIGNSNLERFIPKFIFLPNIIGNFAPPFVKDHSELEKIQGFG